MSITNGKTLIEVQIHLLFFFFLSTFLNGGIANFREIE